MGGNNFNVYRALFLKSASFQLRQIKSNVFQGVLVGLLMAVLIYLSHAPLPAASPPSSYFKDNDTLFATTGQCLTDYYSQQIVSCDRPYYNHFMFYDPDGSATELMREGYFTTYVYNDNYYNYYYNFNATVPVLSSAAKPADIVTNYTAQQEAIRNSNYNSNERYKYDQLLHESMTAVRQFTNMNQTIQTLSQAMAGNDIYYDFDFSDFPKMMGLFFIPSTLIFILPIFVYTIVHEKQERLVEMMKMMGIGMHTYWISNFTFCMVVYCILALFVIFLGAAGGVAFFRDVNPMTYIILFFLYGLAQTSFAFFLSTFFSKAKTSRNRKHCANDCFPGFALARGIYLITYTLTGSVPFPLVDLSGHGYTPLVQVYVYLFVESPVYLILAWYLDNVLPKENGVNYSPLFPIQGLISYLKTKLKSNQAAEENLSILRSDEEALIQDDVTQTIEFEDEDCVKERRKAHSNTNFLIKIIDLHKKYSGRGGQPAKDALVKFCMALEQGECLGLLGPNGAGKTTLISILCGLSSPTSGTALVAGFDITTEMYKVHQILGFCPQHDILWVDLTVEDHLLFYCRLKGYSKTSEKEHVNKIAIDVGLGGEHLTKKVSELSGGMKRRLSIAIALVGESKLVLLDEPTTGLDPDTRRHVWDIINNYKASRSIIITTHNIDEADVLCSKIAIMSLGSLKCIGTSLYLKNKFGAGYKLTANLSPEASVEDYKNWVRKMFEQAEIDPSAGTVDFIIPASDMNVAKLFSAMKQNKEKFGILEWAINQMSLEEVFLKMVATDESQF